MTWLSSRTRPSSDEMSARDPAPCAPTAIAGYARCAGGSRGTGRRGGRPDDRETESCNTCERLRQSRRSVPNVPSSDSPPSFVALPAVLRGPRLVDLHASPGSVRFRPVPRTESTPLPRTCPGPAGRGVRSAADRPSASVDRRYCLVLTSLDSMKVQLQVKTQIFLLCSHMTQPIMHAVSF